MLSTWNPIRFLGKDPVLTNNRQLKLAARLSAPPYLIDHTAESLPLAQVAAPSRDRAVVTALSRTCIPRWFAALATGTSDSDEWLGKEIHRSFTKR